MKTPFYTCLFFLLACWLNSFAQQKEFEFKNLTQENGLPSNECYFVYRDSKDFLWIAGDQGVVRYDGTRMEHFTLPDDVVFKIREDSKGRIWFFSRTGKLAYYFDGKIIPYLHNDKIIRSGINLLISDAYVDEKENIIINSGQFVNYRITPDGTIDKFEYAGKNGRWYFNDSCVYSIKQLKDGSLFTQRTRSVFADADTVYFNLALNGRTAGFSLHCATGNYIHYGSSSPDGKTVYFFNGTNLICLKEDGSFKIKRFTDPILSLMAGEYIWVGLSKKGAVLLNKDLSEISSPATLAGKSVTAITRDYEGGTWFSTLENGVYFTKNYSILHLTGNSNLTQPVFRVFDAGQDNLLFANKEGIWNLKNNSITPIFKKPTQVFNDLFVDSAKNIFLGGFFPSLSCLYIERRKSTMLPYKNILLINSLSEICSFHSSHYLYNNYNVIREIDPYSRTIGNSNCLPFVTFNNSLTKPGILYVDNSQKIWLGSTDGLYYTDSLSDSFRIFRPADPLFQKGVTTILQMHNGIYCIGIRFGGLCLLKDSTVIATITEKEGLLSNAIKYLLPVKDQVWAATAKGISVISISSYYPLKYRIVNIGKNEGLYNIIINQLIPYQGNILAATSNGIYEIKDPEAILNRTTQLLPFYINSISTYKGDTSSIEEITLPYRNNRLVIRYTAPSFDLPEEIKYYYRLSGSDTTWQAIASNELLLENLIPGNYTLEIRAAIPLLHRFSETRKLLITIDKPWWQNNWFRLAMLLLLAGLLYLFIKKRTDSIQHREQRLTALNNRMRDLEQTALRSQMNPHFIFNCLSSIQQLIVSGNNVKANKYLVKFAGLIRMTLEYSARSFIAIEEEINYTSEYLSLEQLRTPGMFEFSIKIDEGIDRNKTEIPNMMLQPILENAIRHGIKHLTGKKGHITIVMKQETDCICCAVTDNGIGRLAAAAINDSDYSDHKSFGINITANRLNVLTNNKQNIPPLEITDLFDTNGSAAGTRITMRLPYKKTGIS